jgi:hypothetical protein
VNPIGLALNCIIGGTLDGERLIQKPMRRIPTDIGTRVLGRQLARGMRPLIIIARLRSVSGPPLYNLVTNGMDT